MEKNLNIDQQQDGLIIFGVNMNQILEIYLIIFKKRTLKITSQ